MKHLFALLLAALVAATIGIAYAAWTTKTASALEAGAFVTGVICVWLVVRQNIWNFPLGLLNVAARTAMILVHFAFWVGSLWGDAVGDSWLAYDGRPEAAFVPAMVFSVAWAALSLALTLRTIRRPGGGVPTGF